MCYFYTILLFSILGQFVTRLVILDSGSLNFHVRSFSEITANIPPFVDERQYTIFSFPSNLLGIVKGRELISQIFRESARTLGFTKKRFNYFLFFSLISRLDVLINSVPRPLVFTLLQNSTSGGAYRHRRRWCSRHPFRTETGIFLVFLFVR